MEIMQCKSYSPTKVEYPVYGQVKIDGIFGRWDGKTKQFYTRSGNIVTGLEHLQEQLSIFPDYDGELKIPDVPFHTMSGMLRGPESTPDCVFYVFDAPSESEYVGGFRVRYKTYMNELNGHKLSHVHPLKAHLLTNKDELEAFVEKVLTAGHEGVVIKYAHSTYYGGKKWQVQKIVPDKKTECKIVAVLEGKGKLQGMMGAMIAEHNGVEVKVGMGVGLDNKLREKIYLYPDDYIGKYITVSYKDELPSGSLRQPKFIGFRWDI